MSILDEITRDLDWREAEIASMRILLSSSEITTSQRQGLLRGAWALLYAHYEGFCKNTLITYYDFISRSGVLCDSLPQKTKLFALSKKISEIRKASDDDFLSEVNNFCSAGLSTSPVFPDVDTQSNLWPNVLIELLETADLCADKVREHELKLKTLVGRRNKIAHGENNIIAEFDYYISFEKAVYDVIYDLALQVDNRLSLPPFSL